MPDIKLEQASSKVTDAVRQEIEHRRGLYQERDDVMHQIRKYRLMRHQPYVPTAYQRRLGGENAVKLPIMYRLVQTAVSAVAKHMPQVEAEAFNAADRKAAEDMSKASSLLLQAVDSQSRTPFLYGMYFNLFGDGMAVTKSMPGPWSGFPLPNDDEDSKVYNQRVSEFVGQYPLPFYTRIVDPITFYPPLEEFGDAVVIERAWRPTREVMRSLNLKTNSAGNDFAVGDRNIPEGKPSFELEMPPNGMSHVEVSEVWSKDAVVISIAGSDRVWQFENQTGEIPYEWGFADPTGVEDPTNIGMSVGFPLYYIVPWIDTMVGIMTAWSLFAAPTPYTTQDPTPGVRPTAETSIETFQPGKMYHYATGRKPGILSPPPVGGQVTQFLNFMIESTERGGLPALVSGAGVGTRLPALTFQAAFEAATDRLRPAVQSGERIIGGTIDKWLKIIARYDMPVKVNGWEYTSAGEKRSKSWAQIKPEQAKKHRRINVSLAVDSTQDLIAKGTHAQFMQSAQLWDVERAMRFSGVENPEETRDKIDADTIRRMSLEPMAQAILQGDPQVAALLSGEGEEGAEGGGEPPGPGRNREGVPAGRGGGRRGTPTQKPRGNRQGTGKSFGRT